jgi:hypothetical protein
LVCVRCLFLFSLCVCFVLFPSRYSLSRSGVFAPVLWSAGVSFVGCFRLKSRQRGECYDGEISLGYRPGHLGGGLGAYTEITFPSDRTWSDSQQCSVGIEASGVGREQVRGGSFRDHDLLAPALSRLAGYLTLASSGLSQLT